MITETPNALQSFLEVVRPGIKALPMYNAGLSIDYVREEYGVTEIAKLGSNENPYGASPRGVIVKPWREAAFSDHVRVSIGLPAANDQFLNAWKSIAR